MCTQQIKTFNLLNNEAQNYCQLNESHKTMSRDMITEEERK